MALDVAATAALLLTTEDRKKRESNETQTDSGFSSKSENLNKERKIPEKITTEKTRKQAKTEQQNSETSSESQDMDIDKPCTTRGMYKIEKYELY